MGRRRGKPQEDGPGAPDAAPVEEEQPRCSIAISGDKGLVAVSRQNLIKLLSLPSGTEDRELQGPDDGALPNVRTLCFDVAGDRLLATTDTKLAITWNTADWGIASVFKLPKRVTSTVCTRDGKNWLLADKYGDVLAAPVASTQDTVPQVVLGHCSSILTSIALSPDGTLLASADRDQKIRVSRLPDGEAIAQGAPVIQTFCLGHAAFVTSVTFLAQQSRLFLVSGGGDGTVRLWDPMEGVLLDTAALPWDESSEAARPVVLGVTAPGGDGPIQVLTDASCAISHLRLDLSGPAPRLLWDDSLPLVWDRQPHAAVAHGADFFLVGEARPEGIALGRYGPQATVIETLASDGKEEKTATLTGDIVSVRHLMGHLAKKPPSEDEVNFRKRQRRDLNQTDGEARA